MRAVFLDRDGVINHYRSNYVRSKRDFIYYDFTRDAFRILGRLGLPLVVVTNQSGIARGYQSADEVAELHRRLSMDAARWGAPIAAIQHCPHLPSAGCACRKPNSELFERAALALGLDFEGSYMVGDSPGDMQAGRRLSMVTVRVETGRGGEPAEGLEDWRETNFLEAARRIARLETERRDASPNENEDDR